MQELVDCTNKDLTILGSKWRLIFRKNDQDVKLRNSDGYCDDSINTIVVEQFEKDDMCKSNLEGYTKHVMRHEIIHAFLFESGLANSSNWARNEEMIDYFAKQIPKMIKVFEQAEAL